MPSLKIHFRNPVKISSKAWAEPSASSQWAGAYQHHLRTLQWTVSREVFKSEVSSDSFLGQSILKKWVSVKPPMIRKPKAGKQQCWCSPLTTCCSAGKQACVAWCSAVTTCHTGLLGSAPVALVALPACVPVSYGCSQGLIQLSVHLGLVEEPYAGRWRKGWFNLLPRSWSMFGSLQPPLLASCHSWRASCGCGASQGLDVQRLPQASCLVGSTGFLTASYQNHIKGF